jgi:hypothetical protein
MEIIWQIILKNRNYSQSNDRRNLEKTWKLIIREGLSCIRFGKKWIIEKCIKKDDCKRQVKNQKIFD